MKAESSKRGARAIGALRRAARYANKPLLDPVIDPVLNRMEAKQAQEEAEQPLQPPGRLVRGAGEVLTAVEPNEVVASARAAMLDTLEHPNMISVDASEQRMEAALGAGVLQAAVDAAGTAKAENSLEKMLCHQMAAAHHVAMKLVASAADGRLPPVEAARLANAAARMMEVYQAACLTLQKLKTRGQQRVLVQYQQVTVEHGGQAVVAGRVGRGSRKGISGKNG